METDCPNEDSAVRRTPPKRCVSDAPARPKPRENHVTEVTCSSSRNSMLRNRDTNSARRRRRPKPTPSDHRHPHRPKSMRPTMPRRAEANRRSSFDWVMLEPRAETPDLHVTAAPGYRTPKCSIPHAAYRRDRPPPKRPSPTLPREGPRMPPYASPKRPARLHRRPRRPPKLPFQDHHHCRRRSDHSATCLLPPTEADGPPQVGETDDEAPTDPKVCQLPRFPCSRSYSVPQRTRVTHRSEDSGCLSRNAC